MKHKFLLLVVLALILSLALTACVGRKISKITIVDGTFSYEYEKDSTPDLSGLKVIVTYSDGIERELTADKLELGTIDTSSTGKKSFTITYDGYTLTVDVTVKKTEAPIEITLEKIEIDPTSVLSKVKVGDTYSTAGLKVSATYSDNSKKDIALADLTVTAPDTATAGAKKLSVSYEGKTAELNVTVVGVKSLTLIGDFTSINKGETLDTSGITANVIYTDDSSEALANEKLTFAAFDTAEAGLKTLTATYLDGQATASIHVVEPLSIGISGINDFITNIPEGEDIDLAAVKNAAVLSLNLGYGYNVVVTRVISDKTDLTVVDEEINGMRCLTFTYAGLTKSIPVLEGEAEIVSIAINFGSAKNYVALGKTFETEGIYLVATYTNDTTANITEGFTLSDIVTTEAGNKTLTATYDGKSATATVSVLPVASIAVKGAYSLSTMKGTALDAAALDALVFTVTYSDGTYTVFDDVNFADVTASAPDVTAAGEKTFTVTFVGASCSVEYTVHTESSITLTEGDTTIALGDSLNTDSLVFEVTYTDGSKKTVTVATGAVLENGFESKLATEGVASITVTYGDATGSFSVTVKGYTINGIAKPTFMQQFETADRKKGYLNQSAINDYVVGDDNDFIFRLDVDALDGNDNPVKITDYTGYSQVYIVDGSTERLLEGDELALYLDYIDETSNAFNFSEAAIGKTFKIATIPASIKDYTNYIKTFTFKVVDGWNIYTAKELNILTNSDGWDHHGGANRQVSVAKDFLASNNIKTPTGTIAGMIVHGDLNITMDDLPSQYFIDIAGEKFFYSHFPVYSHSVDHINANGSRVFTFYGNFFTIYSHQLPIIAPDGTWGNDTFGAMGSNGISSAQLFLFKNDYIWESARATNTYDGSVKLMMENLHLMDDDPNDPLGTGTAPERAKRGLIAVKARYLDVTVTNTIIERYYISMFADLAFVDMKLDHVKFYNAWQNHVMAYANNEIQGTLNPSVSGGEAGAISGADHTIKINITNSELTVCGGPVILTQTDMADTAGNINRYNVNSHVDTVIDANTEIWTYVTSSSVWFDTFGASSHAAMIESLDAAFNAYGRSYRVANPLAGFNGTFMNMIYLNMNAAFGISGIAPNVNGTLTIGDKVIMNMDADNVMLGNLENAGAPVFQSSAYTTGEATALSTVLFYMRPDGTNQMLTNDFASLMAGQEPSMLTDPNHLVFSGDYINMYYMGMGMVFGDYHAHGTSSDTHCKSAN